MYILKNAWISIMRNKGKNLLIGLIILIIAAASTVTLAIKNTSDDLIESYKNAYDKELTITFDRSNMMGKFDPADRDSMDEAREEFENMETLTIEDIESYSTVDHIDDYYYTYSISLNGNSIDKVSMESNSTSSSNRGNKFGGNMPGGNMGNSYDFTLTGYSNINSMSEFITGTYTMSEINDDAWDVAFDGNYVFINQELADYNSLSLGDEITLESDNLKYKFTIIGIFQDNEETDGNPMSMFSNSVNNIVTNASALKAITDEDDFVTGNVNATFLIDDYRNAEEIQEDFYELGLGENYIVRTNEETVSAGVSSIQNVSTFATTFLVITLLIGATVLFVINMINIRERKYEIGVLRTIGMSKLKLSSQFVFELSIIAIITLLIGAAVGSTMSKSISNSLLESEISASQSEMEDMRGNFGGNMPDFGNAGENRGDRGGKGSMMNRLNGVPNVQAYDSIDAVVDIKVVLEMLGIGLALVFISSIASMMSIQRFSPLTILKERS